MIPDFLKSCNSTSMNCHYGPTQQSISHGVLKSGLERKTTFKKK